MRAATKPPLRGYVLTAPGLEGLAAEEVTRLGARVTETLARFDRRDSIVLVETRDPRVLLRAALAEDVFLALSDVRIPRGRGAPKAIAHAVTAQTLATAMQVHHALTPKHRGRSFATVARVAGRQTFRREDLDEALGLHVAALLPHWRRTGDHAEIELWAHVVGGRALIGLRLSGDDMAQRRDKRAHLPASLKPTVARALVVMSGPRSGEVVLDPMAGAGTILRERADTGRARLVAGGDTDPNALAAARINIGRVPGLALWDATRLPVRSGSVDAIITNPPYGRQHETASSIERLYRALLRETARVLRPGGRAVVLTGEPEALRRALPGALRVRSRLRLLLRGLPATAFVLARA